MVKQVIDSMMKTAAYQVKYDMLGRQWNRWDPSLNALVWNYAYIY